MVPPLPQLITDLREAFLPLLYCLEAQKRYASNVYAIDLLFTLTEADANLSDEERMLFMKAYEGVTQQLSLKLKKVEALLCCKERLQRLFKAIRQACSQAELVISQQSAEQDVFSFYPLPTATGLPLGGGHHRSSELTLDDGYGVGEETDGQTRPNGRQERRMTEAIAAAESSGQEDGGDGEPLEEEEEVVGSVPIASRRATLNSVASHSTSTTTATTTSVLEYLQELDPSLIAAAAHWNDCFFHSNSADISLLKHLLTSYHQHHSGGSSSGQQQRDSDHLRRSRLQSHSPPPTPHNHQTSSSAIVKQDSGSATGNSVKDDDGGVEAGNDSKASGEERESGNTAAAGSAEEEDQTAAVVAERDIERESTLEVWSTLVPGVALLFQVVSQETRAVMQREKDACRQAKEGRNDDDSNDDADQDDGVDKDDVNGAARAEERDKEEAVTTRQTLLQLLLPAMRTEYLTPWLRLQSAFREHSENRLYSPVWEQSTSECSFTQLPSSPLVMRSDVLSPLPAGAMNYYVSSPMDGGSPTRGGSVGRSFTARLLSWWFEREGQTTSTAAAGAGDGATTAAAPVHMPQFSHTKHPNSGGTKSGKLLSSLSGDQQQHSAEDSTAAAAAAASDQDEEEGLVLDLLLHIMLDQAERNIPSLAAGQSGGSEERPTSAAAAAPPSLSLLRATANELSRFLGSLEEQQQALLLMKQQIRREILLFASRLIRVLVDCCMPTVVDVNKAVWLFYRAWLCDLYTLLFHLDFLPQLDRLLHPQPSAAKKRPSSSSSSLLTTPIDHYHSPHHHSPSSPGRGDSDADDGNANDSAGGSEGEEEEVRMYEALGGRSFDQFIAMKMKKGAWKGPIGHSKDNMSTASPTAACSGSDHHHHCRLEQENSGGREWLGSLPGNGWVINSTRAAAVGTSSLKFSSPTTADPVGVAQTLLDRESVLLISPSSLASSPRQAAVRSPLPFPSAAAVTPPPSSAAATPVCDDRLACGGGTLPTRLVAAVLRGSQDHHRPHHPDDIFIPSSSDEELHFHPFHYPTIRCGEDVKQLYRSVLHSSATLLNPHAALRARIVLHAARFFVAVKEPGEAMEMITSYLSDVESDYVVSPSYFDVLPEQTLPESAMSLMASNHSSGEHNIHNNGSAAAFRERASQPSRFSVSDARRAGGKVTPLHSHTRTSSSIPPSPAMLSRERSGSGITTPPMMRHLDDAALSSPPLMKVLACVPSWESPADSQVFLCVLKAIHQLKVRIQHEDEVHSP